MRKPFGRTGRGRAATKVALGRDGVRRLEPRQRSVVPRVVGQISRDLLSGRDECQRLGMDLRCRRSFDIVPVVASGQFENLGRLERDGRHPASQFTTTHWSVVLRAGQEPSPESRDALERLCLTYWYPLYAYVRRHGHGPEDSQDITQEFFLRLLEHRYLRLAHPNRGRFRTFLLSSLKNFLVNEWIKTNREKRGSGRKLLSLDEALAESRLAAEPAQSQPPDALYDRGWAGVVMERAMTALRAEFEEAGRLDVFEQLKIFVWGEKSGLPHVAMAAQLGMTEGAVKVAVHRLRRRYGELLRAEVAQTVATPIEVEEELRYLASVIRSGLVPSSNPAPETL